MSEPALVASAILPVVETFERLGIGYFIGGSVASSIYGVARTTVDADLIAAVEARHADAIATALEESYYVDADMIRDAVRRERMFNVVHLPSALKVDIYVLKQAEYDLEAFHRRREDTLIDAAGARRFHFGSAEDILLYKLHWFRLGGELSERQWSDVLGILRIQGAALDSAYLDRWAKVLAVSDLLVKARGEAG